MTRWRRRRCLWWNSEQQQQQRVNRQTDIQIRPIDKDTRERDRLHPSIHSSIHWAMIRPTELLRSSSFEQQSSVFSAPSSLKAQPAQCACACLQCATRPGVSPVIYLLFHCFWTFLYIKYTHTHTLNLIRFVWHTNQRISKK